MKYTALSISDVILIVMMALVYTQAGLAYLGCPIFVQIIVGFAIGFKLPSILLKWMHKEDKSESESE